MSTDYAQDTSEKSFPLVTSESKTAETTKQTKAKPSSSIRVSSDKLDELMNLVSQLVTTQASLQLYASEHQNNHPVWRSTGVCLPQKP